MVKVESIGGTAALNLKLEALFSKFYMYCRTCMKHDRISGLIDVEMGVEKVQGGLELDGYKPVLKVKCRTCGEWANV